MLQNLSLRYPCSRAATCCHHWKRKTQNSLKLVLKFSALVSFSARKAPVYLKEVVWIQTPRFTNQCRLVAMFTNLSIFFWSFIGNVVNLREFSGSRTKKKLSCTYAFPTACPSAGGHTTLFGFLIKKTFVVIKLQVYFELPPEDLVYG